MNLCVFSKYIYLNLKKRRYYPGTYINKRELKEILFRTLFNKGKKCGEEGYVGGDKKGVPADDLQEGIDNLCRCGVIKRINYNKYEIQDCDNKISKRKWILT